MSGLVMRPKISKKMPSRVRLLGIFFEILWIGNWS